MREPNRPISSWTAATAENLAFEASALVDPAGRFEGDVGAEAVVHRLGDQTGSAYLERDAVDHDRVADADQLLGLFTAVDAEVDVHLLELDDLLALLGVEQVDRLAAGDTGHGAVVAGDGDPLADQYLWVPATDRGEVEEALLVDVGDDQADLVDVADDGDMGLGIVGADGGDAAAEPVGRDGRETGGVAPDFGGIAFVSGGA